MDKKIAGLLGAVAALGALTATQASAAPADALKANSYAELLVPMSNAANILQALDKEGPAISTNGDVVLTAAHHHHHHHHHPRRKPRHHHHH